MIAKTELEKMIDEEMYNSLDKELVQMRINARTLTREFNNLTELDDPETKTEVLKKLFNRIGESTFIEPNFRCDYGFNISCGKNFYMNFDCVILDCARVVIGDNVLCGPKVQIVTPLHPIDPEERLKGLEYAKEIIIGNNVWIGSGAIISGGVTIGDNTTIGAGSVVTRDIPSNVFAAGVPCRIIKVLKKAIK